MVDLSASLDVLKRDKRLAPVMKKHGVPDLHRYHGRINVFEALLRSIIYQQLSSHAARAIHTRVLALFPRKHPTPQALLNIDLPKLRACGLSTQKVGYVKDLARKCSDGTIAPRLFPKMSSQEITEHVVAVKGIGEWSAHMLLIFTLRRSDILPTGDLGIRKGFKKVYGLRTIPDKKQMEKIARPWRQYASYASWYLWAVADDAKKSLRVMARSVSRPKSRRQK